MEDNQLDRIENKIDKHGEHLSSIDVTLAAQHQSLKDHMRRTELLEAKLEPIEEHVANLNGILKFIGFLSVLVGLALAARQLFE